MSATPATDTTEGLTPRRLAFCDAVADGQNASSAYRLAYNAENMAPATIHRKAAELMADGRIRARIGFLREALADVAIWSRADSVAVLADVARNATDRPAARVAAVATLNKLLGLDQQPEAGQAAPAQITFQVIEPDGAG